MGGGDSRFVDALIAGGYRCVTVLDVSAHALRRAEERVGPAGAFVRWIASDVIGDWHVSPVDVWHDRAVFHFLTEPEDRAAYIRKIAETVKPGGHVIVGTFADDGPERCSGLPVQRYSPEQLAAGFSDVGLMIDWRRHTHLTPSGRAQPFTFILLQRSG